MVEVCVHANKKLTIKDLNVIQYDIVHVHHCTHSLGNNCISSSGAQALSETLSHCTRLQSLL